MEDFDYKSFQAKALELLKSGKPLLGKDAWQLYMDRKSKKLYTIHLTTDEQQDMKARYYVYNIKTP